MIVEDYKRINFKDILDILDPDLASDFKQTSYFHNDFKRKLAKRKVDISIKQVANDHENEIKIADPCIGDSDNYM